MSKARLRVDLGLEFNVLGLLFYTGNIGLSAILILWNSDFGLPKVLFNNQYLKDDCSETLCSLRCLTSTRQYYMPLASKT